MKKYEIIGLIMVGLWSCSPGSGTEDEEDPPPLEKVSFERSKTQQCHFEGHVDGVIDEVALPQVMKWADVSNPKKLLSFDGKFVVIDSKGLKLLNASDESTTLIFEPSASIRIVDIAVDKKYIFVARDEDGTFTVKRHLVEGDALNAGEEMLSLKDLLSISLTVDADSNLIIATGETKEEAVDSDFAGDGKTLQGAVLRINPNDPQVPISNNPSYGKDPGLVYAVGVRNPAGCTIDKGGAIWCADTGKKYAEIHRVKGASDLGWPDFDGLTCALHETCKLLLDQIPQARFERTDDQCGALVGGVYSSPEIPALNDTLYFANTCENRVHALLLSSPDRYWWDGPAADVDGKITGMGNSDDGKVFVLSEKGIFEIKTKIDKAFPKKISESGCFGPKGKTIGMIPYDVNAILWTDGATKDRWIEIPPGTIINTSDPNYLDFPKGSTIAKNFSFKIKGEKRVMETRIMVKGSFGWEFHTYAWKEDGSDADLMLEKKDVPLITEQDGKDVFVKHLFPDRANCRMCHGSDLQVLGPRIDQMDRKFTIGGTEFDGLKLLRDVKYIPEETTPTAMIDPYDESLPLDQRARAYLHTNCAHCHRPGGWKPPELDMDLRYDTPFKDTQTCGVRTVGGAILAHGPRIKPGDPEDSVLYKRLTDEGLEQMPPIARSVIPPQGKALIKEWIEKMEPCSK